MAVNRFQQAEQEYKQLIQMQPDNPAGYMGLIQIAALQLNWQSALQYWEACLKKFPDLMKPQGLFAKLRVLLELDRLDEASVLAQDLVATFPDYFGGYFGLALVAESEREWAQALQHLDTCSGRFSGPLDTEWQAFRVHLLMQLKRLEEAERLALDLSRKYPGCPEGYIELARLAGQQHDRSLTFERWQKAYRLFPEHKGCAFGYIECLNEQGEFETAQEICRTQFEKTGDLGFQLCLVDSLLSQLDNNAALQAAEQLIETYPDSLDLKLKKIAVLINHWQREQADQAVQAAQELYTQFQTSSKVRLKLIDAYIHAGQLTQAQKQLRALPETAGECVELKRLRAWSYAYNGEIFKARELFSATVEETYYPALDAPLNLKRIDQNRLDPTEHELFLFSLVKDNVRSMPWFLDYYRKLGVQRFFIVDNDSTDGTSGYLQEQPDVHLFWTDDSFYTTGSGLRWINHLVSEYGAGHWCVLADSDEALVVPGVETHGLAPVLQRMEQKGHEALSVFLLDMYPETVAEFASFPSSGDLLDHSPYFETGLRYFDNPICPYRFVKGGVRERLFGGVEVLEKVAIIRGGGGIRFLHPHAITPAAVSDVTGVYLHFCLVQKPQLVNAEEQITSDRRIGDRSGASRRRYARYHRVLSTLDRDACILCADSKRYIDSDQLVELGLMVKPDGLFSS